jgi:hypothetical protein
MEAADGLSGGEGSALERGEEGVEGWLAIADRSEADSVGDLAIIHPLITGPISRFINSYSRWLVDPLAPSSVQVTRCQMARNSVESHAASIGRHSWVPNYDN